MTRVLGMQQKRIWSRTVVMLLGAAIVSLTIGCSETVPTMSGGTPDELKREANKHRQMRENEAKNK